MAEPGAGANRREAGQFRIGGLHRESAAAHLFSLGRFVMVAAIQRLFASNWPLRIYLATATLLGLSLGMRASMSFSSEAGWYSVIFLRIVPVVVAPVLAFYLSLLPGWALLSPLYCLVSRMNGAPFRVGDRVRILVGPHRDRVVQVYDVWEERGQVRVELGAQPEVEGKDVFSFMQVCRESAA